MEINQLKSLDMNTSITISLYDQVESLIEIPEMYVYLPKTAIHPTKAVVICGGGGFNQVNIDHEGRQFAEWLVTIGIAGIVLNYRFPKGSMYLSETDLIKSIEIIKSKASEWNINKNNIGAAGFSIGGHIVATLATKREYASKPNFTLLFYPVISMRDNLTHEPSRKRLLGNAYSEKDIMKYSIEDHVSSRTPKALIMCSDDDKAVSSLNSIIYYERLKFNNIPSALYVFPVGGHGWGMKEEFIFHNEMLSLVEKWLKE